MVSIRVRTALLCLAHIFAGSGLAILAGATLLPAPVDVPGLLAGGGVILGVFVALAWTAWLYAVWSEAVDD